MRLLIVRHGESTTNADREGIKQPADMNSVLTDLGIQQAEKAAAWLKENVKHVDLIYSSSLNRAQQTAAPIAQAYQLPVEISHRIREGGYNYADGSPIPDDLLPIDKMFEWHTRPFDPFDDQLEECESFAELKERVAEFLDIIQEAYLDKTLVVVTHGWTMNAFYDVIFNNCVFRQCFFRNENTAITYLEYDPSRTLGPWIAHFIAQTPHLGIILDENL
ncbi:MAG: histidine phosphatase family protein [Chloroflexota bacterium]